MTGRLSSFESKVWWVVRCLGCLAGADASVEAFAPPLGRQPGDAIRVGHSDSAALHRLQHVGLQLAPAFGAVADDEDCLDVVAFKHFG